MPKMGKDGAKGQRGRNREIDGAKRGMPGVVDRNTDIANDRFSQNWASPLNADNSFDPGPSLKGTGGVAENDLPYPENPMGFGNVYAEGSKDAKRRP